MKSSYRWLWILVFTLGGVLSIYFNQQSPELMLSSNGIKGVMHKMYSSIVELRPYISNPGRFSNDENKNKISQNLKKLSEHSERLYQLNEIQNTPTLKSNAEMFRKHTRELVEVFSGGDPEQARWMLNASFSFCISCHTQTPQKERPNLDWKKDVKVSQNESLFDYAEFNFITRRFDTSVKIYDHLIRNYPAGILNTYNLETAAMRKLTYFTRIAPNPKEGIKSFKKDLENSNLPHSLQMNMSYWIKEFEQWQENQAAMKNMQPVDLLAYIEKDIKPKIHTRTITPDSPHLVTFLNLSGVLYRKIHSEDLKEWTPHFLYYLGKIEKQLGYRYTFSLSARYFERCTRDFPNFAIAEDCLEEYEKYTGEKFNDRIPEGKSLELEQLKENIIKLR